MSTTLTKPQRTKTRTNVQKIKLKHLPHTPNYINLMPPGHVIKEKMFEMGIDAAELARRMKVPTRMIEQLVKVEIPLTLDITQKLEEVTWMPASLMMRFETRYREKLEYAMNHQEIPAYFGTEIINQPKKKSKK
jgi:plasmid maintenance system antidote protein VapI